jgi:hypothetical protein
MAQELLRYQPTADGHEGWRAHITELVAIANKDLALVVPRVRGSQIRWRGIAPRAPEMVKLLRPRR